MATKKVIDETISSNETTKPVIHKQVVEAATPLSFLESASAIKSLSGYNFWIKFLSVFLGFNVVVLSFYGLISLFTVFFAPIAIFIPLFFFGVAGYIAYIITRLWKSGSTVSSLQKVIDQDEYNQKSLQSLDLIRSAIKLYVIGGLAIAVFIIVFITLSIAFFAVNIPNDGDGYNFDRRMQMPLRDGDTRFIIDPNGL
jgi:hypothetical protein